MSNLVPLRLLISPLPPGFEGTPQDFADAIEQRAQIVTDQAYSLFVIGSSAPTTNEGPLFLNGTTPYVWDVITGAYVPIILDQRSLRYLLSTALPANNNDYDVVYLLDGSSSPSGAPLSINVWYNGAWSPIGITNSYLAANYYTQAQTNTAISSAISGINHYPFKVLKTVNQSVSGNSGDNQVSWQSVSYDPAGRFSGNTYLAAVHGVHRFTMSVNGILASGSPTGISMIPKIRVNGAVIAENDPVVSDNQSFRTTLLSTDVLLNAGDVVDGAVAFTTTGASTWNIDAAVSKTYFCGSLVQTI